MARPRKSERQEPIREQILDVATERFGRSGFHAVSLAEIAQGVGIKAPSLLYHFGSKGTLYEAVVERFYGRIVLRLIPPDPGAEPLQLIVGVLQRLKALETADRDMLATLVIELVHDGRGGGQIDQVLGPILEALIAAIRASTELSADGDRLLRPILALVLMAFVFELESDRIPAPVAALRDTVWGVDVDPGLLASALLRGLVATP